jgi:hypothetical protein
MVAYLVECCDDKTNVIISLIKISPSKNTFMVILIKTTERKVYFKVKIEVDISVEYLNSSQVRIHILFNVLYSILPKCEFDI